MTGIKLPEGVPPFAIQPQPEFLNNMPVSCGIRYNNAWGIGHIPPVVATIPQFSVVVDGNIPPMPSPRYAQWVSEEDVRAYQEAMAKQSGWRAPSFPVIRYLDVKRLHPDAILPTKNHEDDAGFDLYALEDVMIEPEHLAVVLTGVAIDVPRGFVGLIWPRSGMAVKRCSDVFAGVIDAGYRGDVSVCLYNAKKRLDSPKDYGMLEIKKGDRVGQILIQEIPKFTVREVQELGQSARGEKGYGSSGR